MLMEEFKNFLPIGIRIYIWMGRENSLHAAAAYVNN